MELLGVIEPANTLLRTTVIDENKNRSAEYSDLLGRKRFERRRNAASGQGGNFRIETRFDYNNRDQIIKVTSPEGNFYDYTYNSDGTLRSKKIVGQDGPYEYVYNERDLIVKTIYPDGKELVTEYDSYNRPVKVFYDGVLVNETEYFPFNDLPTAGTIKIQKTRTTDGNWFEEAYIEHDEFGRPTKIMRPKFNRHMSTSNADAIQNIGLNYFPILNLEWEPTDHLLKEKSITSLSGTMSEKFEYTTFHELKKKTDIHSMIDEYAYDAFGRLVNTSTTNGLTNIAYTYNFSPNIITELTTFGGNVSTPPQQFQKFFDGFGKIDKIERHDGALLVSNKYDNMFRLSESYNLGSGNTLISYQPNPLNRISSEQDAENNITLYKYNGGSNAHPLSFSSTEVTDANGHTSTQFVDGIGRSISSISGEGGITKYQYDERSRLKNITNPDNLTFDYTYTPMSTLETKKVPGAQPIEMFYDNRELLVAYIQDEVAFLHKYDELNRLVTVYSPDNLNLSIDPLGFVEPTSLNNAYSSATGNEVSEISYNNNHLVSTTSEIIYHELDNPSYKKNTTVDYDAFSRPVNEIVTYPDIDLNVTFSTVYNGANLPTQNLTQYDNRTYRINRTYDDVLRLSSEFSSIIGLNAIRVQNYFGYNTLDQMINKQLGYRYLVQTPFDRNLQTITYEYDNIGRLTHINEIEAAECNFLEDEIDPDLQCNLIYEGKVFLNLDLGINYYIQDSYAPYGYSDCNIIEQIVINGDVIDLPKMKEPIVSIPPSPFYFDLLDPDQNYLRQKLQEIIEDLGFDGHVVFERTADNFPGSFNLKILLINSNINNLELRSKKLQQAGPTRCTYTFDLSCCGEGTTPTPLQTMMQTTSGSRPLYAQLNKYNGLDIEEITFVNGCRTGVVKNIYSYDKDHRLVSTSNEIRKGFLAYPDAFSEAYSYSPSGNILSLHRQGIIGWDAQDQPVISKIDEMSYTYDNMEQLQTVQDSRMSPLGFPRGTTGYTYDGRGNVVSASGRGAYTIEYNDLNLPYKIQGKGQDEIWYTYSREKLRMCSPDGPNGAEVCRIYLRNLELEWDSADEVYKPKAWHHSDGKIMIGNNPQAPLTDRIRLHYYVKDHLGNTVVTFEDRDYNGVIDDDSESSEEVIGRYHYYSFGMTWANAWYGNEAPGYWQQRYRYNGKELHRSSGLLDYGFRYYDPGLGRFTGVDPLAEIHANIAWSPYAYVWNSPIKFIDPDGRTGSDPTDPKTSKIAVDPGHGDHNDSNKQVDPGAVNGDFYEKDIALEISNSITNFLSENGFNVTQTRDGDVHNAGKKLDWRLEKADGSDIFVSVHLNSSSKESANGFEVFYKKGSNNSEALAQSILDTNTLFNSRGIKEGNFRVLNGFKGTAVLIEAGFISNTSDLSILRGNACSIGCQIGQGIIDYLNSTK